MVRNLLPLLEILSILYGLAAVSGRKMVYNIHAIIFIIAEMFLMIGINDYNFPKQLIAISYILIFIYCVIGYQLTAKEAILIEVITVIVLGILQLIMGFALTTIFKNNDNNSLLWEVIAMAGCLLIVALFGSKVPFDKLLRFLLRRNKLLGLLGGFAIVAFGSQIILIKQRGYLSGKDYIPIVYFILLFMVIVIEWQKAVVRAEKEKAQLEMNTLYFSAYEEMIKSIRQRQHDFKNHLNALRGMIQTIDNDEELRIQQKQYMDNVLSSIEDTSILTMIENPPIAGFLSDKIHEAEKRNIIVDYNCTLRNTKLHIAEYKLVEMMGIIMDNAIEAAVLNNELKAIKIELSKCDQILHFEAVNSWNTEDNSNINQFLKPGYSSKGKDRGIGLEKLRNMLLEEGGELLVSINEEIQGYPAIKFGFDVQI